MTEVQQEEPLMQEDRGLNLDAQPMDDDSSPLDHDEVTLNSNSLHCFSPTLLDLFKNKQVEFGEAAPNSTSFF